MKSELDGNFLVGNPKELLEEEIIELVDGVSSSGEWSGSNQCSCKIIKRDQVSLAKLLSHLPMLYDKEKVQRALYSLSMK